MSAAELAAALRQMARAIDLGRYRKATRGPKKKKPVARKVYRKVAAQGPEEALRGC
jgi:hypothetical protein